LEEREGEGQPGDVVTAKYVRAPALLEQLPVPEPQKPDGVRASIPADQDDLEAQAPAKLNKRKQK
jgi:hypothetical protein